MNERRCSSPVTREVMSADAVRTLLELWPRALWCGVLSEGAGSEKQEGVLLQEGSFGPYR